MQITLDDQPLAVESPTLRQAMTAAVEKAEADGRMVVEVLADGAPVSDDLLGDPPDDATWTCAELKFASVEPRTLASQSFGDALAALSVVRSDQVACAEHAQLGRTTEAYAGIQDVLATWQSVQQVVLQGAQIVGLDLDALRFTPAGEDRERTVPEAVQSLAQTLGELARAVTDQDWAAVADVLDGELDEQAELWSVMLDRLDEVVSEK